MSIDLKCPQCASELDVPDTAAGKKARCPDCGAVADVPLPARDEEAADVLLAGDGGGAIAAAPAGATVTPTPPPEAETATVPPRRRRPVAAASLLKPPRNSPARVGSAFALLSLVPGLALLFGPLALVLGLVGLIVGRFKGMARGTRDVVAALGLGLLTTAGNWGLVLYVVSVLGLPAPVSRLFHTRFAPPPPDAGGIAEDPLFGFPHHHGRDPFGDEDRPNPARRKSLKVGENGIDAAAFSSDGKRAAIRHADNVDVWELETEQHRSIAAGRGGALSFSPDGKWLAVGRDNVQIEIRLYDADTGECQKTLTVEGFAIPPQPLLAFSRNGSLLAVGNAKGVRLWRTAGWEELTTGIKQEFFQAGALALSPDGSTLAVGYHLPFGGGSAIMIWDTRQGKEKGRLEGHDIRLEGLAFAPDGKLLAAAGWDDVKVWDVAKETVIWSADRDPFDATLAFSPDSRVLAICGRDDSLVLSEAATGKRLATVNRVWHRDGRLASARFTADDTLLTASDCGVIETWDVAELLKQGPRR